MYLKNSGNFLRKQFPNVLTKEKRNTRFKDQKFSVLLLYHQNRKINQASNGIYVQEFNEG